jgi:hypothetical protein
MPAATRILSDSPAIVAYYAALRDAERQGVTHEGNVRRAFEDLLSSTARAARGWTLVTELSERLDAERLVRYDGVLRDDFTLIHGYWEAKDSADHLDTEIRRKISAGYPLEKTCFQKRYLRTRCLSTLHLHRVTQCNHHRSARGKLCHRLG